MNVEHPTSAINLKQINQRSDLRIVLADPQRRVRSAIKTLLNQQSGIQVIGEAATLEHLEKLLKICQPDVLLIDPDLSGKPEESGIRSLRIKYPHISIIAMSGKPEMQQTALEAGANRFVSKGDPPERLLSAIHQCHH